MDAYNEDAEKSLIGLAMQDAIVAQEVAALPDGLFGLKQMQACQRGIMRLVKQGKNVDLVTLDAEVQCDFQDTALLMQCVQMGISPVMSRQYIAILAECAKRRELATLARKILQDVGNPGVVNRCQRRGDDARSVAHACEFFRQEGWRNLWNRRP